MKIAKRYELVALDKIVPYSRNSRKHPKEQIAQIRASFREFGVLSPCLVDEEYNLVCGHGRLLAAQAEGLIEINCVIAEGLTSAQKKAFIIADNKIGDNSTFDEELLALEFADLKDFGFDLGLTGFDEKEIEKLFANMGDDVKDDDFDLSAALEQAAFVLPGDIWTLGRHRLMCGDSTLISDVHRLMDGKRANLLLTDPPYGVSYQSKAGKIAGDDLREDALVEKLLLPVFKNAESVMTNDASAYIFHADTQGEWFRRAFREAGFKLSGVCQWVKQHISLGRSPYQWKNEPILFGWKVKGKHKWMAGRDQTTVWEYDKPHKSDIHPTMKPLDLLAKPIHNSTAVNALVLDLFSGSFSTGMVCEQTDRICYAMELDTKYASASIRRYVAEYGSGSVSVEREGEVIPYAEIVNAVSEVENGR